MTAVGLGQQGSQAVGSGFEHCETENNRRKIVIPSPPPPLLCIKFFDTRNFLKHRSVRLGNFFGTVRQKKFKQIIVIPFYIKYRNQWWN